MSDKPQCLATLDDTLDCCAPDCPCARVQDVFDLTPDDRPTISPVCDRSHDDCHAASGCDCLGYMAELPPVPNGDPFDWSTASHEAKVTRRWPKASLHTFIEQGEGQVFYIEFNNSIESRSAWSDTPEGAWKRASLHPSVCEMERQETATFEIHLSTIEPERPRTGYNSPLGDWRYAPDQSYYLARDVDAFIQHLESRSLSRDGELAVLKLEVEGDNGLRAASAAGWAVAKARHDEMEKLKAALEVEKASREKAEGLAGPIVEMAVELGITEGDQPITGPHVLLLAGDVKAELSTLKKRVETVEAERDAAYRESNLSSSRLSARYEAYVSTNPLPLFTFSGWLYDSVTRAEKVNAKPTLPPRPNTPPGPPDPPVPPSNRSVRSSDPDDDFDSAWQRYGWDGEAEQKEWGRNIAQRFWSMGARSVPKFDVETIKSEGRVSGYEWAEHWRVDGGWIARGAQVFHQYPRDSKESAEVFAQEWVDSAMPGELSRRWAHVVCGTNRSRVTSRFETEPLRVTC